MPTSSTKSSPSWTSRASGRKCKKRPTGRWIVSLDRAKLTQHSDAILARDYDLLIVDEAHKLKNRSTLAWKFVNQIRKRYVLMLTATPVQNDLMELYSLITILAPGQLGTVRAFRHHFLDNADDRHPKNAPSLRRLLNDVMIRNRRSKVDIHFPKRQAAIYHLTLSEAEWQLYSDVTDYIRRRFQDADSNKHLRLTLVTLQRELSSSPQAVAGTLRKMVDDRAHGDKRARRACALSAIGRVHPHRAQARGRARDPATLFPGKFLIFTEYRQTLETIVRQLQRLGHHRRSAFMAGWIFARKRPRSRLSGSARRPGRWRQAAALACASWSAPKAAPKVATSSSATS